MAYCYIVANGSSLQRSLIGTHTHLHPYTQLKSKESHAQANTQLKGLWVYLNRDHLVVWRWEMGVWVWS